MQAPIAKQAYSVSSYYPQRVVEVLSLQFQQLSGALVRFLAPQDSLHIQTRELNGQTTWIVSDRTTQARQQFTSEQALRTWLEERYYQ